MDENTEVIDLKEVRAHASAPAPEAQEQEAPVEHVQEEATQEVEAPPVEAGEKLFSQADLDRIIAGRLAKVKTEAIQAEVEKLTAASNQRIKELETELAQERRSNQARILSAETGLKYESLMKTGLSGKDLEDLAKEFAGQVKGISPSAASLLDNAANSSKKNWLVDAAAQLTAGM